MWEFCVLYNGALLAKLSNGQGWKSGWGQRDTYPTFEIGGTQYKMSPHNLGHKHMLFCRMVRKHSGCQSCLNLGVRSVLLSHLKTLKPFSSKGASLKPPPGLRPCTYTILVLHAKSVYSYKLYYLYIRVSPL